MEHLLSGAAAVDGKGRDENAPPENGSAAEAAGHEPAPRPLTPLQPLPKLPPISSLTHVRGVPPSLQSAPPPASRPTGGSIPSPDEAMCRYRNKLCLHPRALKRNGELHNLCEKHRAKANQNQRKLESKRRVQKRQNRQAVVVPPRAYQLTPSGAAVVGGAGMHPFAQSPLHGSATLPSLAQLQRLAPPPSGPPYPYYDGNYPPYSQ